MTLYIGTSGFSYADWKGPFYPENMANRDMLSYYARYFNCVEINVSYYTIPAASTFERMARQTPDDFSFVIKLNRETTHTRKDGLTYIDYLKEATAPLAESNKLGGYLAQFPFSFKNNQQNRHYLSLVQDRLADASAVFVEFRHDSWLKPAMYDFMRGLHLDFVNVDQPKLKGLLPAQNIMTGENSYFRLHGRNAKDWWEGEGSARYNYEYSGEELEPWMIRISELLKTAYKNYVFFNNHPTAKAVRNAQMLQKMLEDYLNN